MGMVDEQWAFLQDVARLIAWCAENQFTVTGGELWRPDLMQAEYLRTGLTTIKRSRHQDRLAIDLNLLIGGRLGRAEDYAPLGRYWVSLNPAKNVWGGDWKTFVDAPHFERRV